MAKRFKVNDLVVAKRRHRTPKWGIGIVTVAEMMEPATYEGRRIQGERRHMEYTVWWPALGKIKEGLISSWLEHYRGDE